MSFSEDIRKFAGKSRKRALYVFREATADTIDIAQEDKGRGGKMPVDTGFLRNSGQASLDGLPTGLSRPRTDRDEGARQEYQLAVAKAKINQTIWFGWTANYARRQESVNGFMRSAAQRWPNTVDQAVVRAKRLIADRR